MRDWSMENGVIGNFTSRLDISSGTVNENDVFLVVAKQHYDDPESTE
jgi:hypothetical protein